MLYHTLMMMSKIIRLLPYDALLALGRVLGNLYYLLVKKQRERAVAQMMPALNVTESEARKLVRESFVNLARNMLDILYMPNLNEKNLSQYIEIDHLERMRMALMEGNGVVVLTGHIGTWQSSSPMLNIRGHSTTCGRQFTSKFSIAAQTNFGRQDVRSRTEKFWASLPTKTQVPAARS